jgi:hypothetical protein
LSEKWKSIKESKSNNGTQLLFGVGMLLLKIVPFVKTASMKAALNAKLIKLMRVKEMLA